MPSSGRAATVSPIHQKQIWIYFFPNHRGEPPPHEAHLLLLTCYLTSEWRCKAKGVILPSVICVILLWPLSVVPWKVSFSTISVEQRLLQLDSLPYFRPWLTTYPWENILFLKFLLLKWLQVFDDLFWISFSYIYLFTTDARASFFFGYMWINIYYHISTSRVNT